MNKTNRKGINNAFKAIQIEPGSIKNENKGDSEGEDKIKPQRAIKPKGRPKPDPNEIIKMVVKVRRTMHTKLKVASVRRQTTMGQLVEEMIEKKRF